MNTMTSSRLKGENSSSVQLKNRSLILNIIRSEGITTQTDLVKFTGLNKATISLIINEFKQQGIIEEKGYVDGNNGRRLIGIGLVESNLYSIVIRINTSYLAIGLFDESSKFIIAKKEFLDTQEDLNKTFQKICEEIDLLLPYIQERTLLGIGVAVEGHFYIRGNRYVIPITPESSDLFDIGRELEKKYTVPILVNGARNFHSYYYWSKYEKDKIGHSAILNINVSYTIECGIMINGEIILGACGLAGNIGELITGHDEAGKRQTLNSILASTSIVEKASKMIPQYPASILASIEKINIRDVIAAYYKNDPIAHKLYDDGAKHLGVAIGILINILNPSIITFADELPNSSEFVNTVLDEVKQQVCPEVLNITQIKLGDNMDVRQIQSDTSMMGTSMYVTDNAFNTLSFIR